MGGPAERFEDVPVERRGMSGRVADASGKAFADDRAQSLIPVCNAARPRRAPKVSGLGDLCGEAGQASQQGQSQPVGAFEGNGGRSVFGGGQHGISPTLGNQPTQAQAPQSPEEVPSRLRHLLIDPPMLRGESPTKLGVLKPFHQGRAIAVGFVQVEAIGDERILEKFLDFVECESALQALQHLQEARGEWGRHEPSTAHQSEGEARLGSSSQRCFDEWGLLPRIG